MRKKKLNYWQRWRMKHRPVLIYLSLEEYEALKELADKTKLSYRELLYSAVKDIEKLHEEVVRKYADIYNGEVAKIRQDYEARVVGLERECEARVAGLKRDCEVRLSKLRQEYEDRLKGEYDRGYKEGARKMRLIMLSKGCRG